MKKIKLQIEGIKCEGCIQRIDKTLKNIKGINSYTISLENKHITIEVQEESLLNEIIEKIEKENIIYFLFAIKALIFIPSSENISSCSVIILISKIGSLCKSYVFVIISKPDSSKYFKLSSNNSSSSVLK